MSEVWTLQHDTNFDEDRMILLCRYPDMKTATAYTSMYREELVKWEDLPQWVREAVAMLDAMGEGKGRTDSPIGSKFRTLDNRYVSYDIGNPYVREKIE